MNCISKLFYLLRNCGNIKLIDIRISPKEIEKINRKASEHFQISPADIMERKIETKIIIQKLAIIQLKDEPDFVVVIDEYQN